MPPSTNEKLLRLVEELWDWTNFRMFVIKKADGTAFITYSSQEFSPYANDIDYLVYGARRHKYRDDVSFYCFGDYKIHVTLQVDPVLISSWIHNTRLLLEKYPELLR